VVATVVAGMRANACPHFSKSNL